MTDRLWAALDTIAANDQGAVVTAGRPRGGGVARKTVAALVDRGLVAVNEGRARLTDAGARAHRARSRAT